MWAKAYTEETGGRSRKESRRKTEFGAEPGKSAMAEPHNLCHDQTESNSLPVTHS